MKAGIRDVDHYYAGLWPYIRMHSGEQMISASQEDPEDSQSFSKDQQYHSCHASVREIH